MALRCFRGRRAPGAWSPGWALLKAGTGSGRLSGRWSSSSRASGVGGEDGGNEGQRAPAVGAVEGRALAGSGLGEAKTTGIDRGEVPAVGEGGDEAENVEDTSLERMQGRRRSRLALR